MFVVWSRQLPFMQCLLFQKPNSNENRGFWWTAHLHFTNIWCATNTKGSSNATKHNRCNPTTQTSYALQLVNVNLIHSTLTTVIRGQQFAFHKSKSPPDLQQPEQHDHFSSFEEGASFHRKIAYTPLHLEAFVFAEVEALNCQEAKASPCGFLIANSIAQHSSQKLNGREVFCCLNLITVGCAFARIGVC